MPYTIDPREKLIWAAVDLDGTLAESVWPEKGIGKPIKRNVVKLRELHTRGWKIVIHTARGWEDYELIESWLRYYDLPFSRIVCGKILAQIYIDDRARHAEDSHWLP